MHPSVAAGVDDGVGGVEQAQGEEPLTEIEPDALDRVEFGAVGGQDDQGDVYRDREVAADVPAGAVEHQDKMGVGRAGRGDMIEEDPHGGGVDGGQDQRDVLAGGGTNRGEDVGPLVAELLDAGRPLAAPPPAMADPALVADPRLVLEPQLDPFVGMVVGDFGYACGKPPFLKASCASASRFGW